MRRVLLASVLLVLWLPPLGRADHARTAQLDGTWLIASAELGGKVLAADTFRGAKLTLAGEQYAFTTGDGTDRGTMTVDARATPPALDIKGTEGPNRGRTILAIFELRGDALTICYDLGGTGRPTELRSKANTQLFLVKYRRAKP